MSHSDPEIIVSARAMYWHNRMSAAPMPRRWLYAGPGERQMWYSTAERFLDELGSVDQMTEEDLATRAMYWWHRELVGEDAPVWEDVHPGVRGTWRKRTREMLSQAGMD